MDKKEFINSIVDGALRGKRQYGILPSLTIAQAILESGWGTTELSTKANNLFGIKAFYDWEGDRITLQTTEWYNGEKTIVNADFRAYCSFNDSIDDHNELLSYTRYEPVRGCTSYKEACEEIYRCGYATDPSYTEKLIRIIEENKLYEFDGRNSLEEVAVGTEDNEKILKFQRLCNRLNIRDCEGKALVEDNILGLRTKSCIRKMPMLMEGASGVAVEFVQEFINIVPVDGIFGPITKLGVMKYQRDRNIEIDGIVGLETWTAIINT